MDHGERRAVVDLAKCMCCGVCDAMHSQQIVLAVINAVGGIAVLGSYAYGIWGSPAHRGELWGGVPEGLKPFYFVSMLLAALGFFLFSYFILFRLQPDEGR